jgi:hypothetical protein
MRASASSSTDVLFADSVLCEQQQSFFGDFLPISKMLPAGRRTAEALFFKTINKSKVAGFPLPRE